MIHFLKKTCFSVVLLVCIIGFGILGHANFFQSSNKNIASNSTAQSHAAAPEETVLELELAPTKLGSINFEKYTSVENNWVNISDTDEYIGFKKAETDTLTDPIVNVKMYDMSNREIISWVHLAKDFIRSTDTYQYYNFEYYGSDAAVGSFRITVSVEITINGVKQIDTYPHAGAVDEYLSINITLPQIESVVIEDNNFSEINSKVFTTKASGSIEKEFVATVSPSNAPKNVIWEIVMISPEVCPNWLFITTDENFKAKVNWTADSLPTTLFFYLRATSSYTSTAQDTTPEKIILNFKSYAVKKLSPTSMAFLYSGIALFLLPVGAILAYMIYCSKNRRNAE